jgi:hypothetical protein
MGVIEELFNSPQDAKVGNDRGFHLITPEEWAKRAKKKAEAKAKAEQRPAAPLH